MKNEYYYAVGEKEILTARTPDDAVIEYLEELCGIDDAEFPIVVEEFAPMSVWQLEDEKGMRRFAEDLLQDILERLDDEYANPEVGVTEPDDDMMEAAMNLTRVIKERYRPWACEKTGRSFRYTQSRAEALFGSRSSSDRS